MSATLFYPAYRGCVPRRRDGDPDGEVRLPLGVTPATNGEYVPEEPTRHDLEVEASAIVWADDAARAVGLERRRFLQTAGGVAAVLATIDLAACSSSERTTSSPSATKARSTTSRPGGSFAVPPAHEIEACEHALGGPDQFVVDVHTHHVMPDGPWTKNAPETVRLVLGMVAGVQRVEPTGVREPRVYLHDLFFASDTTVAMLSDVPNSGPVDVPFRLPINSERSSSLLSSLTVAHRGYLCTT